MKEIKVILDLNLNAFYSEKEIKQKLFDAFLKSISIEADEVLKIDNKELVEKMKITLETQYANNDFKYNHIQIEEQCFLFLHYYY